MQIRSFKTDSIATSGERRAAEEVIKTSPFIGNQTKSTQGGKNDSEKNPGCSCYRLGRFYRFSQPMTSTHTVIGRRAFLAAAGSVTLCDNASAQAFSYSEGTAIVSNPGFALPANATDCHSHIFDPVRFPYSADRRYTPPPATVAQLLRMHESFGIQRAVLVQPSVYGTDNSCMLSALRTLGQNACGIAVIDRTFSRARLEDMVSSGVRGVRINLEVNKTADAAFAARSLLETSEQIGDTGLLILVFAALPVIVKCASTLASIKQNVLLDHFGLAKASGGVAQPGFAELIELVRSPNIHMKLSGPYQVSERKPSYSDIQPIAQALLAASPGRVVWGSDWPHTGGSKRTADFKPTDIEPFREEDDGRDIGLIKDWAPAPVQRQMLLVDNPARLFAFKDGGSSR